MKSVEINKTTLINEILNRNPEVAEIMMAYGLHCVGCHFSEFDTVGDGARVHGMPDEEIELMIKDINKIVKKKK